MDRLGLGRCTALVALLAAMLVVLSGVGAAASSSSVRRLLPEKCCVPPPPVPTLTLVPTSGPQFSAVQAFGTCNVFRPQSPEGAFLGTPLDAYVALQDVFPNPHAFPNIVASWKGDAADNGPYNNDLTWDLSMTVTPGRYYFGFTWCTGWSGAPFNSDLLLYVGPSNAAWFCVTGPNVPVCTLKLSGFNLEAVSTLAYMNAYIGGVARLFSLQGAQSAPPTSSPPNRPLPTTTPPPTRSSPSTTSTSTTTTTTTPLRRVPG